jgi:glyoxylase-like metal-dependent hydrolase (beta-lactamase superfamily II)
MIRHLPNGHTDGDAVIFFKNANVIHMGDLFFAGRFPYVDLGSGGTVGGYMANVESVLDRIDENTKIIPGHGQLATKSDLEAFRNMLAETTTLVHAKIKNAAALADIQKEGLPEKWQSWGSGFINQDRWIEAIFNSYSREMSSK